MRVVLLPIVFEVTLLNRITLPRTTVEMNIEAPINALIIEFNIIN